MPVVEDLSEEERYLLALLQDPSGIDLAEFLWTDETAADSVFRCWDFQYPWYRTEAKFQIDQCARAIGKSVGIQMRAFAFAFTNPGEEMLITAPEMIHLDPVTKNIEDRIVSTRVSRELLKKQAGSLGLTHRPFEAKFVNGARIIGRIPQKDGKGVKGMHPKKLEMDEAQDYPEAGWVELGETLKYGNDDATWRSHGVSRGVRDRYYKQSQPNSGWFVHRYTGMHRPDWTAEERASKAELYGSRDHPDYRRNILGLHGDAQSPLFVLNRLMACVDSQQASDYNTNEYAHLRINDERLRDSGLTIGDLIDVPVRHSAYESVWIGMDVGMTNHPTEILVYGETDQRSGLKPGEPATRLKLLLRLHLERIASRDQRLALEHLQDVYRPRCIAMDRTGLGLPIWSEIMTGTNRALAACLRGYNFSEKIIVGYEQADQDKAATTFWTQEEEEQRTIWANVLEYASDQLRALVDAGAMLLPWDTDLLREFQGQTYQVVRSTTNPYGRKQFNMGKFHCLDAARMAVLPYVLQQIEASLKTVRKAQVPVLDTFLMA